jgi:tetratricopeptide (TPR) repeat protein
MRGPLFLLVLVTAGVGMSAATRADTLLLKDGTTVEGQVSKSGSRYGVITESGVRWFDEGQVDRVRYDPLKTVDRKIRAEFLAVKAEAGRKDTPAEAIALWEKYLATYGNGPLAETMREEIAAWRKAETDGLVFWGGKMVRPEEREQAQRRAVEFIDAGLSLIAQSKFAEARRPLDQADRLWNDHPTVDFFTAEVLRNTRQPRDAALRLTSVLRELPDHVPTLNNLACLCAQLGDYRPAVVYLARALRKAPDNDVLVNNAWEVLHMIERVKQGDVLQPDLLKIAKEDMATINDACSAQQARRAPEDQFRWGSTWITRTQMETYLAARKAVEERLARMKQEMERLNAQLADVDRRLNEAYSIRDANNKAGSGSGVVLMNRKIRDLQMERTPIVDAQTRLQNEARDAVQSRPEPEWSGQTTMIPITSPLASIPDGPAIEEKIRHAILSGQAVLISGDEKPLGRVSIERHHPRSIWNPLGRHGTSWSRWSVLDPGGPYGSDVSALSCRDPAAATPPQLVLAGQKICYVTANPSLSPRISLESLITVLRQQK